MGFSISVNHTDSMGTKLNVNVVHKRFGRRVQQLRKQQHKTQEDLADEVGVSTVYMSHIERGERNTTLDKIAKIATALHVMIKELFP